MKKINWGIIGLGNVARNFSEGFSDLNNAKLLAISSLSETKLNYFRNKYKINKNYIYKNYQELLNCKDIDIVYLALPNSLHYEWVLKAIKSSKKVFVEKPAFLKADHAKNIKDKILNRNLFFTEGYMYRYYPQILDVIELIKSGQLGKVVSMESFFCKNILTKKKFFFFEKQKKIDPCHRLFNKELGGGCILDLGCYPVSFSVLIASLMKEIDYRKFKLKNIKRENSIMDVDIDAEAEISFDNIFTSKIKSSFKKSIGSHTVINCEKGNLFIKNTWSSNIEIIQNIDGKRKFLKNKLKKNIYSYEIENISNDIIEGKNKPSFPGVTIEETKINTEILESWLNV